MPKRPNLTKLAEALTSKTLPAGVLAILGEADGMLTQGESYEATRSLVCEAIRVKLGIADDDYGLWLRDIYNGDQAIYEYDGKTYQVSFSTTTTDGSREATLGEPKEVQVAYIPVGESRQTELALGYVQLKESKLSEAGRMAIKLIEPGWGSSGYYSEEMLERDAPAAFPAGTKMYFDHPTESEAIERPERSVRDLAAVTATAGTFDAKGADGPGVYAEADVIDTYRPIIAELAPHIGLSIRADGMTTWGEASGKTGAIVEKIVAGRSIDFVTEPGAGGKVLELFESARKRTQPKEVDVDPKELAELKESQAKAAKELEETKSELARMKDAQTLREANEIASARLRTTDLPDFVQTRIVSEVAGKVPLKEGAIDVEAYEKAIDERAKSEAEYLSRAGAGRITGMGWVPATEVSEADRETRRIKHYQAMGLSESEAKIAVKGR